MESRSASGGPGTLLEEAIFPANADTLRILRPATDEELTSVILQSPAKSCELDSLPTWLIKMHLPAFLPSIKTIVNTSLEMGTFPSELGHALVTPVLKKPTLDKNDPSNYRPISNISTISKFLEKLVCTRLSEHITRHQLLDPLQSAYQPSHSTETALLKVQNDILRAIDNRRSTMLVLLDLSAAFDTIDHDLLIRRFEQRFGVSDSALQWFSTYFTNRSCQVNVGGSKSNIHVLKHGVPQVSVLGPLSFTIYTTAIGDIIRHHELSYHMYADDIQLYASFDPL